MPAQLASQPKWAPVTSPNPVELAQAQAGQFWAGAFQMGFTYATVPLSPMAAARLPHCANIGEAHLKSPSPKLARPMPIGRDWASSTGFGLVTGAHLCWLANWAGMGNRQTNGLGLGRPK